jgi:hypothetical protein
VKKLKIQPKQAARHLSKNIQMNSPTILSAVAVVGVAATGYLTFKATWKGAKHVADVESMERVRGESRERTPMEKSLLIWKLYVPAVAVGVGTMGCIVLSNRIHARRAAAMVAAYGVLSGDFDEYKEKARELLGAKKADEVDQHMAKADVDKVMASTRGTLIPEGKSWFLDMATKRAILTTREVIDSAMNEMNFTILNHADGNGDAALNDFYSQIGLDPAEGIGDLLGWNKNHPCKIEYTPYLTEDHGAVTAFHFKRGPVPNYWKSQLTKKEFDELANAADD